MANDVRYVYARNNFDKKGKRIPITIAYRFNDETGCIEFNTAICGKKDYFSRKVGRSVASGRLAANKPSHPNGTLSYAEVSGYDERTNTTGPRYGVIAGVLSEMFEDKAYL